MAVVLLMVSVAAIAQVTTSGITGIVMADGEEAIGATVTAKHVPSGSIYRAVTNIDGRYTITGMRAGGPYEVEISYIGFQTSMFTDIQLALGQNAVVDATLSEGSELLQEVVITAKANNTMRSDRSGAVTNLNANQMAAVPNVGRSMLDIMKMTLLVVVTIVSRVLPSMVLRSMILLVWNPLRFLEVEHLSRSMLWNR